MSQIPVDILRLSTNLTTNHVDESFFNDRLPMSLSLSCTAVCNPVIELYYLYF